MKGDNVHIERKGYKEREERYMYIYRGRDINREKRDICIYREEGI